MSDITIKEIKGFEGLYGVDELGNVYSLVTDKSRRMGLLKQYDNGIGYKKVNLYKDGKRHRKYVHRLVAEAFIPNPENKEIVNHIDCNRENNTVSNLEWLSQSENIQYVVKCGHHRWQRLKGGDNNVRD